MSFWDALRGLLNRQKKSKLGSKLHILLCHERFVFRFGVDRVLVMLTREFRRRGHRVTFLGYQFDEISAAAADRVIKIPTCENYYAYDVETLRWLERNWDREFSGGDQPDIAMTAGWPFVSAIPFFRSRDCPVFYQDHGIIPADSVPENGKRALALLGDLKRTFIPQASGVIAVSRFVLETQSLACAAPEQPTHVILNGSDHVLNDSQPASGRASVKKDREPRILILGRFEPKTYKRSELAFELERVTRKWAPDAWFGAFATSEELCPSAPPGTKVEALGHVRDEEMYELIRTSDVTVSLSSWEGFNLPLAESQALGVPCLVFDCGAHSEVVSNRWQLCSDVGEMASKLRGLLKNEAPASLIDGTDLAAFARSRTWKSAAENYLQLFTGQDFSVAPRANPWRSSDKEVFVMDVTNACRDSANSGCVRVARRLAEQLQVYHSVLFVVWDREIAAFRFPSAGEFQQLGSFQGPVFVAGHPASGDGDESLLSDWLAVHSIASGWLVMPEIRHREDFSPILDFAAKSSLRTVAIFHDAIPIMRPDLISDPIYREGHSEYMKALACCDLVVAVSHFSENCLRRFWSEHTMTGRATSCLLPGGFSGRRPIDREVISERGSRRRSILCVSTLEPRKNHVRLVDAFLALHEESPGLPWDLVLVGSEMHSAPEIAQKVKQAAQQTSSVQYLGIVPDEELAELYERCEFTVYPSVIEGFGLPIMESIWYSRPCLCHDGGVMKELASGGGCLAVDMREPHSIQEALWRMMTDVELRKRLREECRGRSVKRWSDYAAEFLALLTQVHRSELEEYPVSI